MHTYMALIKKYTFILVLLLPLSFLNCESGSCEGEPPEAKVESNSYSSSTRVQVTFTQEGTGKTFQYTNIREDNPRKTGPLPAGRYAIQASVSKDTGNSTLRVTANLTDCTDYTVYVNVFSMMMTVTGSAR